MKKMWQFWLTAVLAVFLLRHAERTMQKRKTQVRRNERKRAEENRAEEEDREAAFPFTLNGCCWE